MRNQKFEPAVFIMRDRGTVLRDPDNLFASTEFTPKTLTDCYGNTQNKEGVPYAKLQVTWVKPRKGADAGHFLLKERNNLVDIVEKPDVKIASSYYARMPDKKVPCMQIARRPKRPTSQQLQR